jgi:excisionase family DNA binding protein
MNTATTDPTLYTRKQVAEIFGCAESTVKRWIVEGRVRATRPTQRMVRISAAELNRFIAERTK